MEREHAEVEAKAQMKVLAALVPPVPRSNEN